MSSAVLTYPSDISSVLDAAKPVTVPSPWLDDLRAKGRESFLEQGLPTMKQEEWKYLSLRDIASRSWSASEPGPAVFDFDLPYVCPGSIRVQIVNGQFDRNASQVPAVKGLYVGSLASALSDHKAIVEEHLGSLASIDSHPFAALNTALFHDGVFIYLSRAAMIEPIIEIVHVACGSDQVSAPRVLVVAEEGASAKIVERYITDGETTSLTIPVTEAVIAQNACVEHIRVQDESTEACHIGLWESKQEGSSEYKAYNVAFGGKVARLDQNMSFTGEHSVARLDGVTAAGGTQIIDNHTRLDHAVPNCNSFEIYKQVVDGKATVVFNGKIFVHLDAQKTDAVQTNQTLLLSPDATINSKPQLEIFADDVKCTHGATVGQLEKDQLFYLMQRGINREEAEGLLVYAFAAEVLELISIDEVRDDLEARLYLKLN
jgi:Fe-S cluster assembly protein SufD